MTRASTGAAVNGSSDLRRGRVVDESGGRLPGVAVLFASLRGSSDDTATVTSDQNGEFDMPRLPTGFYRVTAILPGFHGGVAYWELGDPAPALEMVVSNIAYCIAPTPPPEVLLTTRHGIPLTGAQLMTVAPDGAQAYSPVREGRTSCFAPVTADKVLVDIEGLGQIVVKPAGVDPAKMSWNITVDWTALVAKRLRL